MHLEVRRLWYGICRARSIHCPTVEDTSVLQGMHSAVVGRGEMSGNGEAMLLKPLLMLLAIGYNSNDYLPVA